MHDKIKLVTSRTKSRNECGCIEDKSGKIIFDSKQIAEKWKEYIEELYEDERDSAPYFQVSTGKNILKEEVENVIKTMKNGKATGSGKIPIEALKVSDERNLEVITYLCNTIYNSGYIQIDMKQSTFVPLPKKSKAQKCTEFRTISLMTHISKLLLKIIQQRIADKIDKEVSRLQS